MPTVTVTHDIQAPVDIVWDAVLDVEHYADYMENVRSVHLVDVDGPRRTSAWSVLLKGSILEWVEREVVDEAERHIEFEQVDGDLDRFDGHWRVREHPDGHTEVELHVMFEIGLPLLAEMLNPVAVRALRDNSGTMLSAIEEWAARHAGADRAPTGQQR